MKKLFVLMAGITLMAGCAHQTGGVAPSTIPLNPDSYRELGEVRGTDCVYALLGILPLSGGNETKKAVNDALHQIPGTAALVKVTSDSYHQFFILFSRQCTQVDGIAVAPK